MHFVFNGMKWVGRSCQICILFFLKKIVMFNVDYRVIVLEGLWMQQPGNSVKQMTRVKSQWSLLMTCVRKAPSLWELDIVSNQWVAYIGLRQRWNLFGSKKIYFLTFSSKDAMICHAHVNSPEYSQNLNMFSMSNLLFYLTSIQYKNVCTFNIKRVNLSWICLPWLTLSMMFECIHL